MAGVNKVETIRAFVAVDLDAMTVRRVARVADRLRMASGAPSAVWTPPAKIHVTVKFMGELPAKAVALLGKAVGALAEGKRAPRAGTWRLDAFPSVEETQVVVLALEDPKGDLAKLAAQLDKVASKHGIAREAREFRPHVTLARLKRPYDTRRWIKAELAETAGECRATGLTLYRSERGCGDAGGSVYVALARFGFAGETG